MMERRCDRCRTPIPDDVAEGTVRLVALEFTLNDFTGHYCSNEHYRDGDLCDVCARDFLAWLKGEESKVQASERARSKAVLEYRNERDQGASE